MAWIRSGAHCISGFDDDEVFLAFNRSQLSTHVGAINQSFYFYPQPYG